MGTGTDISREDTELSWNLLINFKKIQSPWLKAKTDILEKVVLKGFKGVFSGKQKSINNFSKELKFSIN